MSTTRFSKAVVAAEIERALKILHDEWSFDVTNGYAQVKGSSEAANRAYGEWTALLQLAERLDLEVTIP